MTLLCLLSKNMFKGLWYKTEWEIHRGLTQRHVWHNHRAPVSQLLHANYVYTWIWARCVMNYCLSVVTTLLNTLCAHCKSFSDNSALCTLTVYNSEIEIYHWVVDLTVIAFQAGWQISGLLLKLTHFFFLFFLLSLSLWSLSLGQMEVHVLVMKTTILRKTTVVCDVHIIICHILWYKSFH